MPRGSRSFFYPSVSLGWEFTKLPTFQNQDILSYGKLRASYAQVGQAGDYYSPFYSTPSYGGGFYSFTPVAYPLPSGASAYAPYYILYDPDLKPQNTTNWETGIDLAFWNGRVKFSYTYSYQNVVDQIFKVPCDPTMGYQYKMTNAGRMKTNSHEISLNAALVQTKDWDVNLGVNWTTVENEVVELAEGVESIMLGGFVEPQIRAQAGCTYPNIYGYASSAPKMASYCSSTVCHRQLPTVRTLATVLLTGIWALTSLYVGSVSLSTPHGAGRKAERCTMVQTS
jgi:outer membrane receptor protein involved in Fe transport